MIGVVSEIRLWHVTSSRDRKIDILINSFHSLGMHRSIHSHSTFMLSLPLFKNDPVTCYSRIWKSPNQLYIQQNVTVVHIINKLDVEEVTSVLEVLVKHTDSKRRYINLTKIHIKKLLGALWSGTCYNIPSKVKDELIHLAPSRANKEVQCLVCFSESWKQHFPCLGILLWPVYQLTLKATSCVEKRVRKESEVGLGGSAGRLAV